tara:strand:+ start:268 stop:1068 length:801 start_codon:yes stop_codon:yes gene_type:complete
MNSFNDLKTYEFDLLGIHNYNKDNHQLTDYFNLVRDINPTNNNYIIEAGVFQGASLISTAHLLKKLNKEITVLGFDTWEGFPEENYTKYDGEEGWNFLMRQKKIDIEFIKCKNRWMELVSLKKGISKKTIGPETISLSGKFTNASMDLIRKKLQFLGLNNIRLLKGDILKTMSNDNPYKIDSKNRLCKLAIIDSDLYLSYKAALPFIWQRLSPNCHIFLDEYFSYKFPGARIATDEFIKTLNKNDYKLNHLSNSGDLERYSLQRIN